MKVLTTLGLCSVLAIAIGCSKDKNMDDYRRDQLQQSIERMNTVAGSYSGSLVSSFDKTNLGAVNLTFKTQTNISSSSSEVSTQQTTTISGSLTLKGLSQTTLSFNVGSYDDVTGRFQVTIPAGKISGVDSTISLDGNISDGRWVGEISFSGRSEYSGSMDLQKDAPLSNTSAIEVSGTRLQQIKNADYDFVGSYKVASDKVERAVQLNIYDIDNSPVQTVFKMISPIRNVNVNLDFSVFRLNFPAVLDDELKTLSGSTTVGSGLNTSNASLDCTKYIDGADFGWNCTFTTKAKLYLHLSAKR